MIGYQSTIVQEKRSYVRAPMSSNPTPVPDTQPSSDDSNVSSDSSSGKFVYIDY